jgi:hypothetical protein
MRILISLFILVTVQAHADDIKPALGIKNFRALFYSMKVVTGVTPTPEMRARFQTSIMTRLPQNGRVAELSNQTLLAVQELASLFCDPFAKANPANGVSDEQMLQNMSQRFFSHGLIQNQSNSFKELFAHLGADKNKVFVACTVMLSSSEFVAQ